jgi:putative phosphoesterase
MMVGLLSDIHSNLPALEAVLEELERLGARELLCAGDLVGYNAFPNEVIEMVKRHRITCILGNHDRGVLSGDTSWFNGEAAEAIVWTRRSLDSGSMDYLRSLPARLELELGRRPALMVHGSPRDDDEYVFPLTEDTWPYGSRGVRLVIMGHTHIQWTARYGSFGITVVNPGSVGQPRDLDARAAFALLDTKGLSVALHRVGYDIDRTARAVIANGLPRWLADRLRDGR